MSTTAVVVQCCLVCVMVAIAYSATRSIRGSASAIWRWMRSAFSFLPFIVAFALLTAGGIASIIGGAFFLISCGAALHHYLRVERPMKRIAADPTSLSPADQNDLGIAYYNGLRVSRDYREAMKWFRMAADHGFSSAQSSLGVGYVQGHGVPQDHAEAVRWFRMAADQGNAAGQFNLGRAYYKGHGLPQDHAEAARWFRMAADQGDADARSALNVMQE
jgi:hypothetical protein